MAKHPEAVRQGNSAANPVVLPATSAATQADMSVASAAQPDPQAAWQAAHDSLQKALDEYESAYDEAKTDDQRNALDALADKAGEALTTLNQEDMASRTGSLQAGSADLQAAVDSLTALKKQLEAISGGFEKAADVVGAVDKAISDLSAFINL